MTTTMLNKILDILNLATGMQLMTTPPIVLLLKMVTTQHIVVHSQSIDKRLPHYKMVSLDKKKLPCQRVQSDPKDSLIVVVTKF